MSNETITVPRAQYEQLAADAEAWRDLGRELAEADAALWALLQSPHVRDLLLGEWYEWYCRRNWSQQTAAMATAEDWRALAARPSYAELQRRRATLPREYRERVAREGEYLGGPVPWIRNEQDTSREAA